MRRKSRGYSKRRGSKQSYNRRSRKGFSKKRRSRGAGKVYVSRGGIRL